MRQPRSTLRIDIWSPTAGWVPVGILESYGEKTMFASFHTYWDRADRPILGQLFEQRGPGWRPSAFTTLPTWFSNLLPEGPLRIAIARAARVHEEREFHLLARIGREDLPGAIRAVAVEIPAELPAAEQPEWGDEEQHGDDDDPVQSQGLKFSLDGVQLKFSVTDSDRGLTVPAKGTAGTWIAKLPDHRVGFVGVPEAEFASLEMARAAGLTVPSARLVPVGDIAGLPTWATEGGGNALIIERFDRRGPRGRVHVEELAQVLNVRPHRKYTRGNFETVARATAALVGVDGVADIIDRLVLNILVGNGDAHLKNWAYVYEDSRTPTLSPVYDIVPTVLYLPDDDLGLRLDGTKDFAAVTLASFGRLAEKAGWDPTLGTRRARDAAERVLASWEVLSGQLPKSAAARLTQRRDSLRGILP